MNKMNFKLPLMMFAALSIALSSCTKDEEEAVYDNVLELAINQVTDTINFEAKRAAFLAVLNSQEGVVADKKLAMFFDYQTFSPVLSTAPIAVGMTEYESKEIYDGIAATLGNSTEAAEYFGTFSPISFLSLKPLEDDVDPNLSSICNEPGQILEIAVRDISGYADMTDYEAKRDAFLSLLSQQNGFVEEYQWISTNGTHAVGMTVYTDQNAFFTLSANTAFTESAAYTEFLGTYPPIAGGMNAQN